MELDFIEAAIVPDVLIHGVAYCHLTAPGLWRVACYTESLCPIERTIVCKTIIPDYVFRRDIRMMFKAAKMKAGDVLIG